MTKLIKDHRQTGRQGLAVLTSSAIVVLKHETSILRQRHNFRSIDFKFDVGDNVREVTNPAKFGLDLRSGQDATWGNIYGSCDFYICFLFFTRTTTHTREQIFAHYSFKDAVWCKEGPFGDEKCVFVKFDGVLPPKHP